MMTEEEYIDKSFKKSYPDNIWIDTDTNNIVLKPAFVDGFKKGLDFARSQGQTFTAIVEYGTAVASGIKLPFILWDTYEDGDELIVQIRKK